ncbi:MAG TPA: hypothetical protein VM490_21360 [Armatimonadaceae bacterium]|nr:hypothetical protein [Armatimonadaceae bacterium]
MNIHDLLDRMADAERAFAAAQFVAPCVRGGRVRARVGGIVQTFAPEPDDFEGWGVFQASEDGRRAQLVEEADLPLVAGYLALFPVLRLRLIEPLAGRTWLAYPVNEGDMAQRFGMARPVALHLVDEGRAFETVVARAAGGGFWFEEVDRRADPLPGEALRDALRRLTAPEEIAFPGITPEMRTAYRIGLEHSPAYRERQRRIEEERRAAQRRRAVRAFARHGYGTRGGPVEPVADADQRRLVGALRAGGGQLREAVDRGEFYLVEWETGDGVRRTSAVAKGDLTVLSSGICLAGRDRDFDLQSLVGVIDRRTARDRDED